ncbi:MAG: NAD(P)-dependent oxidoreductase [Pirellulales bacterium]|nr:NAD(P)-dependent oxidoreductase [Pirellulales bacterium]
MDSEISSDRTRIGWIGTGVMGAVMCGHLLDARFSVTVHNRTPSKAEPLLARGAVWAATPREVAMASDVVFLIVGYPDDVRDVVLGPQGILAGARPCSLVVDMTTSQPSLAIEIASIAAKQDVISIDAPVSGGDVGARNGTLSIMMGGDPEAIAALTPCWQVLGKTWIRHGGPGAGQHAKMVNQILIATNMIGVCEGLLYAQMAGLDLPSVMQSVAAGAAGSWSLSNLGPRIIAGNFEPGFFVEHFIKDLRIALDEAKHMGLRLPGLALAEELYQTTMAEGHARDGTHALMLSLAKMSGTGWKSSIP